MRKVCIKEFDNYIVGKSYEYYTNFGGLNHFVRGEDGDVFPFNGPEDPNDSRPHIDDYFISVEENRDIQLDKILK